MGTKKLIIFIALIAIILCSGYYIKTQYYYPGHEYVGDWVGGKVYMSINHEKNHFLIIRSNGTFSGVINKYEQLEYESPYGGKIRYTYLAADDAIQAGGTYYKRRK